MLDLLLTFWGINTSTCRKANPSYEPPTIKKLYTTLLPSFNGFLIVSNIIFSRETSIFQKTIMSLRSSSVLLLLVLFSALLVVAHLVDGKEHHHQLQQLPQKQPTDMNDHSNAWINCQCICCGVDIYEKIENRERLLERNLEYIQDNRLFLKTFHFNHHHAVKEEMIEKNYGNVINNIFKSFARK